MALGVDFGYHIREAGSTAVEPRIYARKQFCIC